MNSPSKWDKHSLRLSVSSSHQVSSVQVRLSPPNDTRAWTHTLGLRSFWICRAVIAKGRLKAVTMTSLWEAQALSNVSCVHRGFRAQSVGDPWKTPTSLLSVGFPWVSLPGPEALLPKGLVVQVPAAGLASLPPPAGRALPAAQAAVSCLQLAGQALTLEPRGAGGSPPAPLYRWGD